MISSLSIVHVKTWCGAEAATRASGQLLINPMMGHLKMTMVRDKNRLAMSCFVFYELFSINSMDRGHFGKSSL